MTDCRRQATDSRFQTNDNWLPITIFWDVDDVLNDLMREWLSIYSQENSIIVDYDQLTSNPPHELLGISIHDFRASLDNFRLSENFSKMKPVQPVYEWFESKAVNTRNMALTATSIGTAHCSSSWVFKNYSKWIRTYHVVPSPRENEVIPEYDKDKIEAMSLLSPNGILIDDNENNVKNAALFGYTGMLFPRPWNSNAGKSINGFLDEINKILEEQNQGRLHH